MTSKKRSAQRKQREEFDRSLGDMDELFARAEGGLNRLELTRERADRARSCSRKQRYASRAEAEEAIEWCARQGRSGLTCYRCDYCGGWHLTHRQG